MKETNEISVRAAQRILQVVMLRNKVERLMHELEEFAPPVMGVQGKAPMELITERRRWIDPYNHLDNAKQDLYNLHDYLAERELDGLPDESTIHLKKQEPTVAVAS